MSHSTQSGAAPPPAEIQSRARELFERVGLRQAAANLQVSPGALARVLAGAPCRRGTVALMTLALGSSAVATKGEKRS
jgi:hypothetical protein